MNCYGVRMFQIASSLLLWRPCHSLWRKIYRGNLVTHATNGEVSRMNAWGDRDSRKKAFPLLLVQRSMVGPRERPNMTVETFLAVFFTPRRATELTSPVQPACPYYRGPAGSGEFTRRTKATHHHEGPQSRQDTRGQTRTNPEGWYGPQ